MTTDGKATPTGCKDAQRRARVVADAVQRAIVRYAVAADTCDHPDAEPGDMGRFEVAEDAVKDASALVRKSKIAVVLLEEVCPGIAADLLVLRTYTDVMSQSPLRCDTKTAASLAKICQSDAALREAGRRLYRRGVRVESKYTLTKDGLPRKRRPRKPKHP